MTTDSEIYDVIIVGGGPAGLTAALYTSRAQLKTLVLDKGPASGALGMTSKIINYPGFSKEISGQYLVKAYREHAESFGAKIIQSQVVGVDLKKEIKEVIANDGIYQGKTVIIATGSMGRKPTIAGESDFIGKGVSYCAVCDAAFFKNKNVAMIGSFHEIMEEIDLIAKFASKIYVITPQKEIEEKILNEYKSAEFFAGSHVLEILGSSVLEKIKIIDSAKKEQLLDVSGAFVFLHGNQPVTDFLLGSLDTTETGGIKVNLEDMSTSIPGVYASGDVLSKSVRQVVLAAADGCLAGLSVDKYLKKREKALSQWS